MSDLGTAPAPTRRDTPLEEYGGGLRALTGRFRGGDLGVLPVVVGLVVIWTVMQILNPVFLSSTNLVNLTLECVPVGVIALGVGFMLLVGQIDLSIGSLSGMAAAVTAILFVGHGLSPWLAVPAAVAISAVVGWLYAQVFNRLGVPSFVITLAGLLGFLGIQLWVLGAAGSINLPFDSGLVTFAQLDFVPQWLSYTLTVVAAAGLFASGYLRARERRRAGLAAASTQGLLVQASCCSSSTAWPSGTSAARGASAGCSCCSSPWSW